MRLAPPLDGRVKLNFAWAVASAVAAAAAAVELERHYGQHNITGKPSGSREARTSKTGP